MKQAEKTGQTLKYHLQKDLKQSPIQKTGILIPFINKKKYAHLNS